MLQKNQINQINHWHTFLYLEKIVKEIFKNMIAEIFKNCISL